MEVLGWVLAVFFAGLAFYFARRKPAGGGDRPTRMEPAGGTGTTAAGKGTLPAGSGAPGAEKASVSVTGGKTDFADTLREVGRYLDRAVARPLEAAIQGGDPRRGAEDAVDALRDLIAYGASVPQAGTSRCDVVALLREVAREYSQATGVTVYVNGHVGEPVLLAPERFKDALFLLFANADRFSRGANVTVRVESAGDRIEVRVRDAGPGFTGEALLKAFEPFWTTEPDSLGLGLTQARRLLEAQGAQISVRNAPDGGGEAVISIPRTR
jgi:signal transduction histidine kinase